MNKHQNEKVDIVEIARFALFHARSLAVELLPGGKLEGKEWVAAGVTGGKGTSCKLNVDTGLWCDFATGEKGGDLVSLWAAHHVQNQLDAAKDLGRRLGYKFTSSNSASYEKKTLPVKSNAVQNSGEMPFNLVPIPDDVIEPNFFHFQYGAAENHWCYYGAGGERLFWVARYQTKDGGKQFCPFSWCSVRNQIVHKQWADPRPLYGLPLLGENPDSTVLIVEGEKAADAARKFLNPTMYTVISWVGGAKAFEKTDWSPLKGRKIMLWPDNDRKLVKTPAMATKFGLEVGDLLPIDEQPGMFAMMGIAAILAPFSEVRYFSLHDVPMIGEIDGFDAADALAMGWKHNTLVKLAKERVRVFVPKVVQGDPLHENVAETEWMAGNFAAEWMGASLILDTKGNPYVNLSNIYMLLCHHRNLKGRVWFDDFHLKVFTTWRTKQPVLWSEGDDLELAAIIQRELHIPKLSHNMVRDAVMLYAHKNRRNEPLDWMKSLEWDRKRRLHEFFITACGAEDNEYTRAVGKNFWVAMAARIFHPGCKMDNMVILEGKQGAFKSTALREIGGPWFTECNEAVGSKDFKMLLAGHLLIEIPELTTLLRASNQQEIKAALSDPDDAFRPPYGKNIQTFQRTCVFVGTTNDKEYLDDETGARRYWPIYVNAVDIAYIRENREQLFAEAVFRYRECKDTWWEVPEEGAKEAQEGRQIKDPWYNVISDWLTGIGHDQDNFRMDVIATQLEIPLANFKGIEARRIGKVLRILGLECRPIRIGEKIEKRWCRK